MAQKSHNDTAMSLGPGLTNTPDPPPAAAAPLRGCVQPAVGLDAHGRDQWAGGRARGAGVPQRGHRRPPSCAHLRAPGFGAALGRQAEEGTDRGTAGNWAKRRQGHGRALQGRVSQFEGAAKLWGELGPKVGKKNGCGLTERGRARAPASRKEMSGWAVRTNGQGRGRAGPSKWRWGSGRAEL